MYVCEFFYHFTQDGNGHFPFPKLLERGSTSSITSDSEGFGVPESSSEHVDATLKGISTCTIHEYHAFCGMRFVF